MVNKVRPKFLNLFLLAPHMSITAKVSILHRLSGAVLFFALPFILYILHKSLIAPDFYTALYHYATSNVCKSIYLVIIAAFTYHMCAGIRFLLLDLHLGINKVSARYSAYAVVIATLIIITILGVVIW